MDNNRALNVEQVAEKLSIARNTVYELIKRGELKSYRVGRKVRVDQSDLEAYINLSKGGSSIAFNSSATVDKIIISGQDGILDVLANMLEQSTGGFTALRSYNSSFSGLMSLYYDECQVTAVHLWDEEDKSYNYSYVKQLVPGIPCIIINLAKRVQGFYVKKGNPKNINSWVCLERDDVVFVNREKGSGSRILLDQKLRSSFIDASNVRGYYNELTTHIATANSVANGTADVGLGTESVSNRVDGIDFIPMQTENYDLVIKKENFNNPVYKHIYNVLTSEKYINSVRNFKGYDFSDIGKIVAET